ncbi:PKD domain-containing protein [Ferruginibacter sp.]
MRKYLLLLFISIISIAGFSQDFSNKGKDFWVGYGNHVRMFNAGTAETMQIYLTSDVSTTGNVSITSIGFTQNFTVTANQITVINIPRTAALLDEGLYNHGIHITALKPVVAYGFIYVNAISGATVFLPTNTLGKDYFTLNYTQASNEPNSYSYFFVEAVETGTTVIEITPSQNTKGGWPARVTQTINLSQGQIYQVLSTSDLTGSIVKSIASGGSSCKKVAVFCGSGKISIGCGNPGSSDNLYQQMYPASTWGKKYVLISSNNRPNTNNPPVINTNFFRIYRPDPTTIVNLNGIPIPAASFVNDYYQFSSNQTNLVNADKPILVAQYFSTAGCSGNSNPHDPEMIYLNPVEQTVTDVTVNSMQPASNTAITQHFINVVLRNSGTGVSSFKIDGVTSNATVNILPQDNNYAYMRIYTNGSSFGPLTSGAHHLTCDSGFNAIAYGFGSAESYGYSAGTNLKDLYQQIGVSTEYGIEPTPSVCTGSPFRFRVSLPYCADSIRWDLNNLPGPPAAPPTIIYTTCTPGPGGPDSTTSVNGVPIYWYSLPSIYSFGVVGTYPVTITTFTTTASTCGSEQDIDFDLQISDPPIPGFTEVIPGCYLEPVQFIETTPQTPKPTYKWYWDFGDGFTSTSKNPPHTYALPGTYAVRFCDITTPGCLSDTIFHTVTVPDIPSATVSGTNTVCLNDPSPQTITFTGSAGRAPYEFTYDINGTAQPVVVSNAAGTYTIPVLTNIAGTFTYNLLNVKNVGSALCTKNLTGQSATVTVRPLPTAAIAGATTVCLNASSPTITFTGSGGTAPYTFAYTINGVAQTPILSNGAGVATLNPLTNVGGPFVYAITTVTDNSSTLCSQSFNNVSTTVTVNDLPTVAISGSATAVCLNAASPAIILTGSGGTAPYTFAYSINGVPQPPVVSNAAGSYTITVPTNAANTFIYAVTSVQEGSANACTRSNITGQSATVIVNPLPTAAIAGATTVCLNAPSPPVTFTASGGTAPYTFAYTINGVPQTPMISDAFGIATLNALTNVAGPFVYAITTVTDNSSTLCSQLFNNVSTTVTILPLPTPNFSYTNPSCDTRVITFTDNSVANAGTINNRLWDFGGGNTATGSPVSYIFPGTGPFTVGLTVTTTNGCSNAPLFTKVVTINDRPQAGFTVPEVCISDVAAVFTDTSKITNGSFNTLGYEWDFGDGSPYQFTKDGTHLYALVGTYTVRHIVTSSLGCKDTTFNNISINGANPVSNFSVTNATALCANDSVSIVNLSTINQGNITKVEIYWDFVGAPAAVQLDDFPAPNKVYRHKYPNFQTPPTRPYTIRFLAYSGTLCVNEKSTIITVNAAPKVQFNAMPDACYAAAPFLITQASEIGGVPGTFAYSGPGIVNSTGLFNPALAGIGTHLIKYTFTSAAAGCVDTISRAITVLDTASAKFSFNAPVCEGTPSTFKEESTAPGGVILSNTIWNFGDGSPLESHVPGSTFTHTFPGWANYTVTMYNVSAYGCSSTSKVQQVYVSPIPQSSFTFVQPSVCLPNASVSFVNNSSIADGTAITYAWDFGDPASGVLNASSARTPPPHIYSGTGPYTVKLTVTGSLSSCFKEFTDLVDFIHPQPKAAFDFNKPGICIGDDVIFTDLTNGLDGTVMQWNWNFGDGITGTNKQEQHLYSTAKTYDVSLYIVNSLGCNSDTLTKQFTVNPYPVVDAGPDGIVLEGGSFTMKPVVTGNDLQYLWSPATYLNNTNTAAPTAINMLDDITYQLVVTGRGGCTAPPDFVFVKVLKAPKVPNTFTPNNDGINDFWLIDYLDTYPNCKVQVFTRTGQLVFESKGYKKPWNGTIGGKPLPFDTYYYIIEPENGRKPITGYVTIVK